MGDYVPYEGQNKIGGWVRCAAQAAEHEEFGEPDLIRINNILVGEVFVNLLAQAGAMITRIPTPPEPEEETVHCHQCGQDIPRKLAYSPGPFPFHWNEQGGGHTTRKTE